MRKAEAFRQQKACGSAKVRRPKRALQKHGQQRRAEPDRAKNKQERHHASGPQAAAPPVTAGRWRRGRAAKAPSGAAEAAPRPSASRSAEPSAGTTAGRRSAAAGRRTSGAASSHKSHRRHPFFVQNMPRLQRKLGNKRLLTVYRIFMNCL